MAIGIVPGTEVDTPPSTVPLDSGAFREAALAPGKLAAAVGQDVGGLFQDVSQKIQANRMAKQVFDADLTMRKSKDDFTAGLAKMPDPGTWLPAWSQQVDAIKEQTLDNPHLGPDARRQLTEKFDVWQAATTAEIKTAALAKGANDSRESAIADSSYAAHQGNIEDAQNILNAAVAHYAMSQSEADKIGKNFPSIAAQAKADMAITTNPVNAPDLIQQFKGTIEPSVFVGIEAKANAARNRAQADNLNDLSEDMQDSPDGTIDLKRLAAKVKAGEITQRGADGLIARMKRENVAEDKDAASVIRLDVTNFDFTSDKTPEETRREFTERIDAVTAPGLRAELTQMLDNKMNAAKKADAATEKPVQTDLFERGKQDFAKGLFRPTESQDITETTPHWFSADTIKVVGQKQMSKQPDNQWEVSATDSERAQATLNYAKWQDSMRGFFKETPDATSEQAEQFSQKLMAPLVEAQVTTALNPPNPIDQEARAWASAHPDDPRSATILKKLSK